VVILGPLAAHTSYFSNYDLVYYLGEERPEKTWFVIDSEWLNIGLRGGNVRAAQLSHATPRLHRMSPGRYQHPTK
jgi:hypothetical protein